MKKIIFSKPCTKGFITQLGPILFSRFFRELFFSGDYPPCSPLGDYPRQSPPPGGLHPPVGRFFFSIFSQKYFFLLKNRHMGDFFGRLHAPHGAREKIFFDFFFWFQPLGDPFWDPPPVGPRLDPVWDPFWTILGPFWTIWSLWVTKEAINRSQMASRCLK